MRALHKRLDEIVRTERPDIIHAHSPILNALPALWTGKKFAIPVVYEVRALWEDAAVDHGTYGQYSLKYQAVRYLETAVCNKADEVIIISRGLKHDLMARGVAERKLTVVGNGVDPGQFEQSADDAGLRKLWGLEGRLVVGFIGSFYRYEGLDLLVDAVARLSAKWPALKLLLVGGGEVAEELTQQISDLGLGDRVIAPGRIPHDQIASVYALTDILVYPRRSMRLTEVVTPLKPLEAMAMGKAIVGSDVGGHKELIADEQTGLLFAAGNVAALVAALDRLLADRDLRAQLGAYAASWVRKERSWQKLIAGHTEIYSRALGENSSLLAGYHRASA